MENQNDIHRELTSLPVGKLLWKYSVPAIVGTMVMSLYNVIDRIFIGQGVGADAISGLALTFPIMSLAGAIGMLVGLGASARISIVLGQNDKVKAEKILANSLVLSLSFAVCYLTFFSVYMDDILRSFGGSDRTIPYAREFLIYIMPGMLCTNLCYSFNNMMRASGIVLRVRQSEFFGFNEHIHQVDESDDTQNKQSCKHFPLNFFEPIHTFEIKPIAQRP